MALFVSTLLHQEVYSVDFVFGDNGTRNWLVSDKIDGCLSLALWLFSAALKGLKEMWLQHSKEQFDEN